MTTEADGSDIVERLREASEPEHVPGWCGYKPLHTAYALCGEAADEITRLRAENERLRKTLKPFAEHGKALEGCEPTDGWCEATTPDITLEEAHVIRDSLRTRSPEAVEKDDEGRPYPCGAFVSSEPGWFCRLESDHEGDHEWVRRS